MLKTRDAILEEQSVIIGPKLGNDDGHALQYSTMVLEL